jgi:hypothetical protein
VAAMFGCRQLDSQKTRPTLGLGFCSQKPVRRFPSAYAAFPSIRTSLAIPKMVAVRRAPEVIMPTIAGVMIRAGLAPPPPAVAPARVPVERSTRWKRYHPYARASLPTRDMDDEYDVFLVSSAALSCAVVHRSRVYSPAHVFPPVVTVDGGTYRALGEPTLRARHNFMH